MAAKECISCKAENPSSANYCRSCGCAFPVDSLPGNLPKCRIENFSVRRKTAGKFIVEWNAVNADKVTLNGIDVTGRNLYEITVSGYQTIVLRADNAHSFDVKESSAVYATKTVYKERIVEQKVAAATNVAAIILLCVFILVSIITLRYAYRLENPGYSGPKYLSNMLGYQPYLLVNGANSCLTVQVPPRGGYVVYNVNTNAFDYEVRNLPSWAKVVAQDRGSFTVSYEDNSNSSERTAAFVVIAEGMNVAIALNQEPLKATGKFNNMRVEHNVFKDGFKGMKIFLDFSVQDMKGVKGNCSVYFYYENGGKAIKDTNGRYHTTDGYAAVSRSITPDSYDALYEDFEIFMPYSELEVGSGKHNLKLYCLIWENPTTSAARSIATSSTYFFTLTKD